jgi:rubrerythrin
MLTSCAQTGSDMGMDVDEFLAHAVRLEYEAARRFEELADAMATHGNAEVEALFRRMAEYSRRHLAEAQARSGFHELPQLQPHEYRWADGDSPEQASWAGVDGLTDVGYALRLALDSEREGHRFYAELAEHSDDPEVRIMAAAFMQEEAEHVAELERWISA